MEIQKINGILSQQQILASQAANIEKPVINAINFSGQLISAINQINTANNISTKNIENFTLEKTDISLNDVMVDMQKASLSLQMGIQVRNKLVSAYQEIMAMQV
ncbi:flagellar hook-basal body complex protein FliE [Providencia sneebia]|uniref:Flagellar hook-basal body complex protein FliE n=1 Tax=Providencia sneebia DSM 19967 TaxID=1141660 RepID=K8WF76_9GAMM|nr:flagellar hook-basal body complex protein FliE [Providencia sneebia]EKT58581.1 flagellar hook-basal body protein FliE [Providencia sneebia DSM 19967]